MIAKVIVDVKHENVDNAFDYKIPEEFCDIIRVGSRVFVEFGLRKVLGYVIEIVHQTEYSGTLKPILEILDFDQNLNEEQVKIAEYIYSTTNAFYSSCLEIMLPSFLRGDYRKYLLVHDFKKLDPELALVIGQRKKVAIGPELIKLWSKVKIALKEGSLEVDYGYQTYGKKRYTKFYVLAKDYYSLDITSLSLVRKEIINYIHLKEKATLEEIVSNVGCSQYLVNDLVKKSYLKIVEEKVIDEIEKKDIPKRNTNYNFAQQELINKYQSLDKKPFLLYTNDEHFQMNFLIDAMIDVINQNKQVLLLAPTIVYANEVSLIIRNKLPQIRLATLTSNIKPSEYYEQYLNIIAGNIDVVVATKVGVFTPLTKLGLVILLDEANQNYINEQNPRFSCRDIVLFRAKYHQAKVILTSLPPSINSYYQVYLSKYYLLRYIVNRPSEVHIINMKEEILNHGTNILSKSLIDAIKETLSQKRQVLLLLNRIAHSTLIRCENCQEVEKCPNCKISLSYYQRNNVYRCNYCNYSIPATGICSSCKSRSLSLHGFGLEQIQSLIHQNFPNAKVLMVDAEKINQDFSEVLINIEEGNVDIILGTHIMIDSFKNSQIELVGIIDPDRMLHYDHFRAKELVFMEIYKCINRKNTKVYIQTYHPQDNVFSYAINNSFEAFYEDEIKKRQLLLYEPFIEINRLLICGEFKAMYHFANYFKKVFSKFVKGTKDVLGPVYLPKYSGVQLIIKHEDYDNVIRVVRSVSEKFKDQQLNIIFEQYPNSFS